MKKGSFQMGLSSPFPDTNFLIAIQKFSKNFLLKKIDQNLTKTNKNKSPKHSVNLDKADISLISNEQFSPPFNLTAFSQSQRNKQ